MFGIAACTISVCANLLFCITLYTMSLNLTVWTYCSWTAGVALSDEINYLVYNWIYGQILENEGMKIGIIASLLAFWVIVFASIYIVYNHISKERFKYLELYDSLEKTAYNWSNLISIVKRMD